MVSPQYSSGSFSMDSWAALFRASSDEKMFPLGPGVAGNLGKSPFRSRRGHSRMNSSRRGSPASSATMSAGHTATMPSRRSRVCGDM